MIIVKNLEGEVIIEAKNWQAVKNYGITHTHRTKHQMMNKPINSDKLRMKVIIIENEEIWQRKQSIIFLKKEEIKK